MNTEKGNDALYAMRISLSLLILAFVFYSGAQVLGQNKENAPSKVMAEVDEFADARDVMGAYMISPLDRLDIVVYAGEKQINQFVQFVKSDGTIYLAFLERDVKIGNMRILEAEDMLEKLSRSFIKEPRIVITVVSSYTQTVSTYGKINSMNIEIKTPMRILQLLARAGGPQDGARADSIRVISINGSITYFNFEKVNKNPTDEENFYLKPGDIIFVPGEDDITVMVFGEVIKPGIIPMRTGTQLLDALLKAGSWGTNADINNVRLLRSGNGKNVDVKEVDMKKMLDKGNITLNIALKDGDIIYVPAKRAPLWIESFRSVLSIVYTMLTTYLIYRSLSD